MSPEAAVYLIRQLASAPAIDERQNEDVHLRRHPEIYLHAFPLSDKNRSTVSLRLPPKPSSSFDAEHTRPALSRDDVPSANSFQGAAAGGAGGSVVVKPDRSVEPRRV